MTLTRRSARRPHAVHAQRVADGLLHGHGGLSAAFGSWNTIWMSRRSSRSRRRLSCGEVLALERDRARRSPGPARAAPAPAWTCRCRSRRPVPRPRRGCSCRLMPSTALTVPVSRPNSRASVPPRRPKCTDEVADVDDGSAPVVVPVVVSGFVGNGQLLLLRAAAVPPAGISSFGPTSQHSTRPPPRSLDVDRVLRGADRPSPPGSAGGSGIRRAGRPGPAARPG